MYCFSNLAGAAFSAYFLAITTTPLLNDKNQELMLRFCMAIGGALMCVFGKDLKKLMFSFLTLFLFITGGDCFLNYGYCERATCRLNPMFDCKELQKTGPEILIIQLAIVLSTYVASGM